jgi:hypothetical protein
MSLCAFCGHPTFGSGPMCPHHSSVAEGDDWATSNRIMCDFLHRGIVTPVAAMGPPDALDGLLEGLETSLVA